MQRRRQNDESTVRYGERAREALRGQKWHRPERVCGECVYGERFVHEGGIYVVIRCSAGFSFPFRGVHQPACAMYKFNAAMASFRQSHVAQSGEARVSVQRGRDIPCESYGYREEGEDFQTYPF